ncbi:ribonuclease D [Pararhodobacter aggregans]|uniref:Ribonuclease D n=1 Tax=Pararhodobacter aggregans TaxID=404875 RepID=A0A2T7UVN8_9RHOB|nr:ribonuclease D [Pararhodobacter aggregans]PTW99514.1 ribonuclease D [Pararhodobacter aggregans]PVE48845.1 ribonuclease D [Pararhodobacter aggregans]
MNIITTTEALAALCAEAAGEPYVTLDTEFLRERTYYAKLCLVQMALPGKGPERAYVIDPLAEGLSLDPLLDLMRNTDVVKVFHAARQDLEIFFIDGGVIPEPLFDTQIAAMVCGFGEQVGYETLVKKIAKAPLDKTSRFTDWSQRPLSEAQLRYALDDVTHLRQIYEHLKKDIEKSGRAAWVAEEMGVLTSPETYVTHPEDAWQKIRTRGQSGKFMALVKELARFREDYAQTRNVPRSRVYKDDALLELASTKPDSIEALGRSRLLLREARRGEIADGILEAVQQALTLGPKDWPRAATEDEPLQVNPALADLLRVLLKAKADSAGVAQRLIAPTSDLDQIAAGKRDVACLKGWRHEIFGADALRLCNGELALAAKGQQVRVIEI